MGSRYLTDLADVCRRTGYPVIEVGAGPNQTGDDWKYRARGSGGYESGRPNHVMAHHTASSAATDGWQGVNYITFTHEDAPLSNLYLSRKGEIFVCAGGASNTNGTGNDPCSPDVTPADSMNSHAIGIEAANDGVGEKWPDVQQDAYEALCAELCKGYNIPTDRIHAHFEYAPDRKIDPAGNSRYATGGNKWDMNKFRAAVAAYSGEPTPIPPTPTYPLKTVTVEMPELKKGATGPYVTIMQHLLVAAGYMSEANTANYDGVWGNGTDDAKLRFDIDHGLTPSPPTDCGPKSWQALLTPGT